MANNVSTPRFYVSWGDYWKSLGTTVDSLYTLNPSQTPQELIYNANSTSYGLGIASTPYESAALGINFFAALGHNLGGKTGVNFIAKQLGGGVQDVFLDSNTIQAGVNVDDSTRLSGFTLSTFPESSNTTIPAEYVAAGIKNDSANVNLKINSFVFGKYYDMPHSPDLSLKLSYEMDGIKNIQTKGGATLSNALYTKPADWGDGNGAWQLGDNPNYRSGRRVWDLSFSYLSDTDVMPVLGIQNYDGATTTDILDGTDFFSQVWNKTMGGHLPFIFQADNSTNSPDGFAIARFDMNSLQYEQVAHNTYNVKLKIRESW
tara:strand:+ start:182 stop:1132 length:951 start_codon:yes stop_codon:yes gene_type:complete